jgi:hypothetical protein
MVPPGGISCIGANEWILASYVLVRRNAIARANGSQAIRRGSGHGESPDIKARAERQNRVLFGKTSV